MISTVVSTSLGALRLRFSPRGLVALEFCRSKAAAAPPAPAELRQQLARYCAGHPVRWQTPLDLAGGTTFQRAVWRVLQTIPHGQTRSYGWVARRVGKPTAARAVGAACGANPIPLIIPCHRVVAGDGSLGGFSGGLPLKRKLLRLERPAARFRLFTEKIAPRLVAARPELVACSISAMASLRVSASGLGRVVGLISFSALSSFLTSAF